MWLLIGLHLQVYKACTCPASRLKSPETVRDINVLMHKGGGWERTYLQQGPEVTPSMGERSAGIFCSQGVGEIASYGGNWGQFGSLVISETSREPYPSPPLWQAIMVEICCCSVAQSDPTLCKPHGLQQEVLHHLLEFTQTHVHRVSDAIHPSDPLLSPFPPAFNLSQQQSLFQWVSSSHQVLKPKYWSFSIGPSNEYSRLISFRMDCFYLLAVRRTLKSLLQHHSSKASILIFGKTNTIR